MNSLNQKLFLFIPSARISTGTGGSSLQRRSPPASLGGFAVRIKEQITNGPSQNRLRELPHEIRAERKPEQETSKEGFWIARKSFSLK